MSDSIELQKIIGQVAAAYFNNSHVSPAEIPTVIGNIATSLTAAGTPAAEAAVEPAEQVKATPAQVRKSITRENLISFEDGKPYKTLRRHLAAKGMTPAEYRAKWGLPADYPLVAPAYSEARANLAKAAGLGSRIARKPAEISAETPAPAAVGKPAAVSKAKGRRGTPTRARQAKSGGANAASKAT